MSRDLPIGVVAFGREVCGDLDAAERREWWMADGLGGYASGTVAGSLTRRYHGLMVAATRPPLGRRLVAVKADATLVQQDGEDTREWPLFTNRWEGGAIDPAGHVHLEEFFLCGRVPVWRFAAGGHRIEKRIWLEPRTGRAWVTWRLRDDALDENAAPLQLRVAVIADARDHHRVRQRGESVERLLNVTAISGEVRPRSTWVERFHLAREAERGLEALDDHLQLAEVVLGLAPGQLNGLCLSLAEIGVAGEGALDAEQSLDELCRRDEALVENAQERCGRLPGWMQQLVLAADSFVVTRGFPDAPPAQAEGETIIAGYPWFGDWGRDTMIALPGLTLATGRDESARRILETFARFVDRGMLPNHFPNEGEEPEYNSVDAALWFVEAWRAYVDASGDLETLAAHFGTLEGLVEAHRIGTRHGIVVDPRDGLLRAGTPGVQLTWMDARVGSRVVTPRHGKPVEINALWYNALCTMRDFARRLGEKDGPYAAMARRARESFARFVREDGAGLLDVLDGPQGDDASIRPNQVFAVSLHHSPLTAPAQRRVVETCRRHLLCSFGLRSLAPGHADYVPRYEGDPAHRDGSYHQGTVWGWLLGHYAMAEHRVTRDRTLARSRLRGFEHHVSDAGLGTISEIFDGDPPHDPRGTPSQAWSVATLLEAWWRTQSNPTP